VCVSVSGVLFSVGVCVCDLLIVLHLPNLYQVGLSLEGDAGALSSIDVDIDESIYRYSTGTNR